MNGAESYTNGPARTPLIQHEEEPRNCADTLLSSSSGDTTPKAQNSLDKVSRNSVKFAEPGHGDVHTIDFPEDDALPEMLAAHTVEESSETHAKLNRMMSHPRDELRQFRNGLRCLGLDQSTRLKVTFSWILFVLFTFLVPVANFTSFSCPDCDAYHSHPFERLVQVSESALAAVSFLCLSHIVRKHGLRRTLLLDKIIRESDEVRKGYQSELQSAFLVLGRILLPSVLLELSFRLWWYVYVTITIPFVQDDSRLSLVLNITLFSAGMLSWLYRTSVFLFTCILFRLMSSLQILRLQGYNKLLRQTPNVEVILSEHMRIRSQLNIISHRFRLFISLGLLSISVSQMWSLFVLLGTADKFNFFRAGDLVVCSMVQLTGLVLCLHGAAKITHRAQRIVSIVSQWHALATVYPSAVRDRSDERLLEEKEVVEKQAPPRFPGTLYAPAHPLLYHESSEDIDGDTDSESDDSTRFSSDIEQSIHDLESIQKRQALVLYLEHARAGISLYGFVLDRGFLYGIFGVIFSVTLFIIGKTII